MIHNDSSIEAKSVMDAQRIVQVTAAIAEQLQEFAGELLILREVVERIEDVIESSLPITEKLKAIERTILVFRDDFC